MDAYLIKDKETRAGIEVMVKDNVVVLGGEVSSNAIIDYDSIVRNVFKSLKFPKNHHLEPENIKIINLIGKQSTEIHNGVDKSKDVIGAGDQGFVVGFASDDTDVLMPLGHYLAKKICQWVIGKGLGLGPDAKSQVIVEYNTESFESSVKQILVSTMHVETVTVDDVREIIKTAIKNNDINIPNEIFSKYLKENHNVEIIVNPCGTWNMGGPVSDCGITGRKLVVDQYGGYSNIGGGNLSGKDYTKVDRSGAYMARYIAKNIVASGIAKTAKVELSYVIGKPEPSSVNIELTGTNDNIDVNILKKWVINNIDLTPYGIMQRFDYAYPRNGFIETTGCYGITIHSDDFEKYYPWEKIDIATNIKSLFKD